MPHARINGIDIFYVAEGRPGQPAIVFSNSLGTDHRMWQAQAAALTDDFHVIRYDTRGHGRSSAPQGPYQIAQLGQDVLALLDFLRLDKVHFCGLSLGGVTGQWLGIHAPHRLDRLVLANTAARVGTSDAWQARARTVRTEGLCSIADGAASRWFSTPFIRQHSAVVASLVGHLRGENREGYASCCEALAQADFSDTLSTISNRTLVIAGQYDPVTTESDAAVLQRGIAGASVVALPASHISNVEAEQAFTHALKAFLKT